MGRWLGVLLCVLVLAGVASAQEGRTLYERGVEAYHAAGKLAGAKKFPEAMQAFERFAREYPTHELADDALMRAASYALRVRKHRQAAAIFAQLAQSYPRSPHVLGALSSRARILRYNLKDYAAAAALFERLGKDFPGSTSADSALISAVRCYLNAKDCANALRLIDACIASRSPKGPGVVDFLKLRIDVRMQQGDLAAAAQEVARLEAVSSNTETVAGRYYTLGAAHWRKKAYEDAAAMYLKAAGKTAYSRAGGALIQAAACHENLRTPAGYGRAVAVLRQYIACYPKGERVHESWVRIGKLQFDRLKDAEEGIKTYEAFLRAHRRSIFTERVLWDLARAHHEAKQFGKAEQRYRELVTRCPEGDMADDAMLTLADLLARDGKHEEALALYRKIAADMAGRAASVQAARRIEQAAKAAKAAETQQPH